jgi:hypothetical protein
MNSKFKARTPKFFCFLSFIFCLCFAACSVPNLEEPECTQARQTVKELYSYHFGNDMQLTPENLKEHERFLTGEMVNNLQNSAPGRDPFTLTDDTPKAFRVGGCKTIEQNKRVNFEVLLFWKTDTRSEQREINVEAVKQNDKWLINKISENNQK